MKIAYLILPTILFSACSFKFELTPIPSINSPITTITGHIGPIEDSTFSMQSHSCTRLKLHEVNERGLSKTEIISLPLAQSDFEIPNTTVDLENKKYLLEVTCSNFNFQRFLTGLSNQNVNFGSTLISWFPHTATPPAIADVDFKKLDQLYIALDREISFDSAYTKLSTGIIESTVKKGAIKKLSLTDAFLEATNIARVDLQDASPQILITSLPTSCQEGALCNLQSQSYHWRQTYTKTATWKVTHLPSTNINALSLPLTPHRNFQGQKEMTLLIGHSDLSPQNDVDSSKPHKTFKYNLNIENTYPPVVPTITNQSTTNGNNIVNLISGRYYTNIANFSFTFNPQEAHQGSDICETFSDIVVTEEEYGSVDIPAITAAPAFATHAQAVTCNNPTPSIAYLLSNQSRKHYKFWTRDSAGNISTTPQKLDITYDFTQPTISITFPSNNSTLLQNGTQTFNWTIVELNLDAIDFEYTTDRTTNPIVWQSAIAGTDITFNSTFTSANWNVVNQLISNGAIRIKGVDLAGNVGYSSAFNFSTSTTSTSPILTLDSSQSHLTNSTSVSIQYDCNGGDDIYISTSNSTPDLSGTTGWTTCPGTAAPHPYTVTIDGTDGIKNIYGWTRNAVSVSTGTTINVTLDRAAPSITALTANHGNTNTTSNYIDVRIEGSDLSGATAFCINSRLDTAPVTSSSSCQWMPVSTQTNINIDTTAFLGDASGNYILDIWVRDGLLQVSTIQSTSAIVFTPPAPARISKVLASTSVNDDYPAGLNLQSFNTNSNLYLKWNFTPGNGAVLSDYTFNILRTNDGVNFTDCPSCISNSCSASMPTGFSHCYIVETNAIPSQMYQYKVEASLGVLKTSASSTLLNVTKDSQANKFNHKFNLLAGYYNVGESEFSTETTLNRFNTNGEHQRSLVIDSHGVIYLIDKIKGLIKYNPTTGAVTNLIKFSSSSVDGLISNSNTSITQYAAIFLDHQDNLYIWDGRRIRYLDFTTQSITTIIGQNSNHDTPITYPRNTTSLDTFLIGDLNDSQRDNVYLWPLTNGDFIIRSSAFSHFHLNTHLLTHFAYYSKSNGSIKEFQITGNITIEGNSFDINGGRVSMRNVSIKIDPTTNNITEFIAFFKCIHDDCGPERYITAPYLVNTDLASSNQTWPLIGPASISYADWHMPTDNPYNSSYYRYMSSQMQGWNGTSWVKFFGTAWENGCCDDTVPAKDCNVNLVDVYINKLNQIFVWDGKRIRKFENPDSPFVTVVGNEKFSNSNHNALEKPIGYIGSLAVHWDDALQKTSIAYSDRSSNALREISFLNNDSPVNTHISGNGTSGATNTTSDVRSLPFAQEETDNIFYDTDGDIIIKYGGIRKLNRATQRWVNYIMNNGVYSEVSLNKPNDYVPFANSNCNTLGYVHSDCEDLSYSNGNGKTLSDASLRAFSKPNYIDADYLITTTFNFRPNGINTNYHGLHLYDRSDDWRQYVLMDGHSPQQSWDLDDMKISGIWFSGDFNKIYRDKDATTDTLYLFDNWTSNRDIYKYPLPASGPLSDNTTDNRTPAGRSSYYSVRSKATAISGDIMGRISLPHQMISVVFFRMIDTDPINPDLFMAYCTNNNEIWVKNLTEQETSGNEEKYELKTPNIRCSKRLMVFNPGRNSLTFGYTINEVPGIAELQFNGKN